jgi:hypothetical protein
VKRTESVFRKPRGIVFGTGGRLEIPSLKNEVPRYGFIFG